MSYGNRFYACMAFLTMIQAESVEIGGKSFEFMRMAMGTAPLLVLKGSKGFVMCGYLNLEAANKLGDVAVRVTGVSDLRSLTESKVAGVSEKASAMGIREGQKVSEILGLLA